MLWVYGSYKYFFSYSAGIWLSANISSQQYLIQIVNICTVLTPDIGRIQFRRQILTTKVDPRAVRVKEEYFSVVRVKGILNLAQTY